jgi:hypothetical protein
MNPADQGTFLDFSAVCTATGDEQLVRGWFVAMVVRAVVGALQASTRSE